MPSTEESSWVCDEEEEGDAMTDGTESEEEPDVVPDADALEDAVEVAVVLVVEGAVGIAGTSVRTGVAVVRTSPPAP